MIDVKQVHSGRALDPTPMNGWLVWSWSILPRVFLPPRGSADTPNNNSECGFAGSIKVQRA